MSGVLAVGTGGTQAPLLVQVLPTVVGGILGLAGVVYGAMRHSSAEHRRWLRQERLKAYSQFFELARNGLDAVNAVLRDCLRQDDSTFAAVRVRADQVRDDLERPVGDVALLGPENAAVIAEFVRWSFGWSYRAMEDLLNQTDKDAPSFQVTPLHLSVDQAVNYAQRSSGAVERFRQVAAAEIQGSRRRWLPYSAHPNHLPKVIRRICS